MLAGLQTVRAQSVIVSLKDGRTVSYNVADLNDIHFSSSNGVEEHEWVDLGLPSGTLWATMNVGADAPEKYGGHFAWGETTASEEFGWSIYRYCKGTGKSLTRYCTNGEYGFDGFADGLTELLPEDDAASVNWGDGCQMPSLSQCYELMSDAYTTKEAFWVNGARVNKITSLINGNYILLPPAGWYNSEFDEYERLCGLYWSRSLNLDESNEAFGMFFDSIHLMATFPSRANGLSVRPVQKLNKEIVPVTNLTLNETSLRLEVGERVQLSAIVEPANATFPAVIWDWEGTAAGPSSTGEVIATRIGTATVICRSTDNLSLQAECQVTVVANHEYVDLGLPSGTLWATMNVGANAPEEYGDYFAWAETEPKESYSWNSYKYCFNGNDDIMTKYNCDEGSDYEDFCGSLKPEDDAAIVNWVDKWQTPGMSEFYELYDDTYTTTIWSTLNGVNGMKITSKTNGNSIFLPAAGFYGSGGLNNAGSYGYYWSSELGPSSYSAWNMSFYSGGFWSGDNQRYCGMSIRPVRKQ